MTAPKHLLAWSPSDRYVEDANVTRLMRTHAIDSIDELRERSITDIRWFWDAVVSDLQIPFSRPYSTVCDDSRGPEWAQWFVDGTINMTDVCVDRWTSSEETAARPALICEYEDGEVETLSFSQLRAEIDALALGLRALGVGPGDHVGVFMPMVPQAVIASYAVAKLGAVYMPIFSGFAASAVAARLSDAKATVLITADGTLRRGKSIPMLPVAKEAVAAAPTVREMIVFNRLGLGPDPAIGDGGAGVNETDWESLVSPHRGTRLAAVATESEAPLMIAYTSGTTGRPKGAVHVHGGLVVKIASEAAYSLDVHPGDRFMWVTDMGWIMGPVNMIGAHANGATMLMIEGAPDWPDPSRIWRFVEREQVNILGVSPTLTRAQRAAGDQWPAAHDLSSLRILGSTGEPWNDEPYRWLMRATGGKVPIMNISGGTEVGACFLTPHPVEPIKECSLGGASLGMDVDVFDADGNSVRGEVGELVCKQPWPGMTRGFLNDPDRFIETYWTMYPGVWRHGDWAMVDEDGDWFLFGRSDEAINVAGKRLGPAEVESVLVADPRILEAAAIGVPDEAKGEAVWCFAVPRDGAERDGLAGELAEAVAAELGRPFKPSRVFLVPALPKTRSAKILRRVIRAVALGNESGDLSSAENPESVDAIREQVMAGR